MIQAKNDIIAALQSDILRLQGFKPALTGQRDAGLGPIRECLPNGIFPVGAVHEFIIDSPGNTASTTAFIASLLASLTDGKATTLWLGKTASVFPPGLVHFGIQPHRCIFVDLALKDMAWAMEESLKCGALTAVIGGMDQLSFTESRRLQLAVEKSQVTGFVLRKWKKNINTTACVSRWKIMSVHSETMDGLPGVGFPKWSVELLRMRNGKTGKWEVSWKEGKFCYGSEERTTFDLQTRKAG